ncbi:MAG TPA: sulfite exporter TauE/SafE family protein [Terriglobales bacterium]|nr:sulfite exporter TauE/SafE family protein [Terriglobales bacterium]
MIPYLLLTLAALLGGGIASIAGFGIGSILTPSLAVQTGTKLAVAAVSIPHVCGTVLRLWVVRHRVNRHVVLNFGLASAAGGLAGALLHTWLQSAILGYLLGALLIFAAIMELTGLAARLRFAGWSAWTAGGLSGLFGGLVGNQGGIRSAAMLGFDIPKESFVATATAIALMVDAARVPVYAATQGRQVAGLWPVIGLMTAGVVVGTLLGWRLLRKIPSHIFRRVVAIIILALGIAMFLIPGR